jgi:K+-sensing histidine kinase KdpD
MSAVATPIRSQAPAGADQRQPATRSTAAPIVAAVDASAASRAAVETAVRLGAEMDAPVVFVYARTRP